MKPSASSVGAVREPTHQQGEVEPLLRVSDGEHNLKTHKHTQETSTCSGVDLLHRLFCQIW